MFVSCAKYADRWVYQMAEEKFDRTAVVRYEIRGEKEEKYCETVRRMSKYGKIRTIVIQRQRDGKRMAIYTNAEAQELEAQKVVQLMCRRWGQENVIKELLLKHFINYTPGYVREPMEEQPLVDNPGVKELKKEKAKLTGELNKLKVQLAEEILKEGKEEEMDWERLKKEQTQTVADIVIRENEMLFLDQEVAKLPEKVRYDEAHEGRSLLKHNYEKKRFLDCIKLYAYNVQKKMCQLLLTHYEKENQILPALSMIVKRGARVRLQGGQLRVQLMRFRDREIDYAARRLCEDINSMGPLTPDKFQLPIHFEVS